MTKKQQLKKQKKKNPKKLDRFELMEYKDHILEKCYGLCQICGDKAVDFHHPYFGRYGADKDDRKLTALCRKCHNECHKSKSGDMNTQSKRIADDNWRSHNG